MAGQAEFPLVGLSQLGNCPILVISHPDMAKRAARDQLTGGTQDVNPQTLVITTTTATNGTTQGVVGLPLPRLPVDKDMSIVMEVINVQFLITALASSLGVANTYIFALTTDPTDITLLTAINITRNPRTIAQWSFQTTVAAAPTSFETIPLEKNVDTTDEAGHGVLVATDNLFFNVNTGGGAAASAFNPTCRVTYRFKQVSLREYIGIVQSQQ